MPAAGPSLTTLVASIRRNCRPGLWSQGVTLARAGGGRGRVAERRGDRAARALARARRRADGRALPDGDRVGVRLPVAREPVRARRGRGDRADRAGRGDRGGGGERGRRGRGDGGDELAPTSVADGHAHAAPATWRSSSAYARVGYRFTRAPEGLKLGRVLIAGDGARVTARRDARRGGRRSGARGARADRGARSCKPTVCSGPAARARCCRRGSSTGSCRSWPARPA